MAIRNNPISSLHLLEYSMQIKQLTVAVAAVLMSTPLFAQAPATQPMMQGVIGMAPEAEVPPASRSADQWAARMADFTKNMSAFKDPAAFPYWINAMSDPSMVAAMGDSMLEPGNWLHMMTTMTQPAALNNYAQFVTDPTIYARWAGAMVDPMWYTKIATDMVNPRKMMGWMMLPTDQRLMATSMKMLDPNLYMKFMMMPTDPRGMALMFAPMNPQLYGSMAGGLVNPQLVGGTNSTWGKFLYPSQPVVSVQPRAPLELPIDLTDPRTYGNVLNIIPGMPSMPSFGGGQGGAQDSAMPFPFNMIPGVGQTAALSMPGMPAMPVMMQQQTGAPATLTLGGDTLFKTGKSSVRDLTAEGRAKLDELVAGIKSFSAIDSIKVTGHADKMGPAALNQKLSLARARTISNYLKSKGVKAASFTTAGMGDTKPLVDCDMTQAKDALKACLAPNRRVEIEVSGARK
ncbi:MAG: OmpA family protein [Thiobacillus sp.]